MNYRHAFHAGNFADVFKHAVLVGLIEDLKRKSAPICYIDTHAGRGRYELHGKQARHTLEAERGVLRLAALAEPPETLARYLQQLRACNPSTRAIEVYPGSPLLVRGLMREHDRALLCELEPGEASALRQMLRTDARMHVHNRDGYAALAALLPPLENRGLVLIDPPFEAREAEFRAIETALEHAQQRWPSGIYAAWYPIKLYRHVHPFHRWLRQCAARRVLVAELLLHPPHSDLRLNGCGMAVLNPPWQCERWLQPLLSDLSELLADGEPANARLHWLRQES